jgi:hypothetical protein
MACSTHDENKNVYKVLVGNPEEKRPLGRHRNRWEHNVKMNLREIRAGFIWLRIGTSGNCNEPSGCIKCWQILE